MMRRDGANTGTAVENLNVYAFQVSTDQPEADGTFEWDTTTVVTVEVTAADRTGTGYTYSDPAAAHLIDKKLRSIVIGHDAMAVQAAWNNMNWQVRNAGRPGLAAGAISAVDTALWDLKARMLDLPLATLLGPVHDEISVYGSGGFTSYTVDRLQRQFSDWVEKGISMVKMKVGRHPEEDIERVAAARRAIGPDADLMVDANGAYSRKQALYLAEAFAKQDVVWFEEPVSSDDLRSLRMLCERAPSGMEITAGEYGYDLYYFRQMLMADAVDVLQIDVTRCGGITGFLKAADLAEAYNVDISAHTAPYLHNHVCSAVTPMRHIEYFHDDVRVIPRFFDGVREPENGTLQPDYKRPGMGMSLRHGEAEEYLVYSSGAAVDH